MAHGFGETTFAEKLGVAPIIVRGIFAALVHLLVAPIRGERGASTAFKHVIFGLMRSCLTNTTTGQQQFVNDDTSTVYAKFAKAKGITADSIVLSNGGKGHWLGNRNAEHALLYFHGGGFCLPSSPEHMEYFYNLQNELQTQGHDIATLYLAYTLAPQAVQPSQLAQAVELLRNLVFVQGKDPANIIIGGDSAGGNIALGVLSHLLHPHPSGIPPIKLSAPLRAAVLISPWVSFESTYESFNTNATSDMLNAAILTKWSRAFLSTSGKETKGDNYSEPIRAPKEWWNGLDSIVNSVLIWGGAAEVLVDSIKELSSTLESTHSNTTTLIVPQGCHEQPILDHMFGYKKGDAARAMDGWISARL